MNTLNIVNIAKYINVNSKTWFIYVVSQNRQQLCDDALQLDDLTDNEKIQPKRF